MLLPIWQRHLSVTIKSIFKRAFQSICHCHSAEHIDTSDTVPQVIQESQAGTWQQEAGGSTRSQILQAKQKSRRLYFASIVCMAQPLHENPGLVATVNGLLAVNHGLIELLKNPRLIQAPSQSWLPLPLPFSSVVARQNGIG
jgi:hypothetical protein